MKGSVAEVFGQKIRLLPQHVPQEHLTSVKSIGWAAFNGCSNLTEITIHKSVYIIDYFAFANCPKLTIFVEAKTIPIGWDSRWNPDQRPVILEYILY